MRPLSLLLVSLSVLASHVASLHAAPAATTRAEHVVVVVWDGLRPDSVSESSTPTLYQLARDGVFFQNHHAAYLSSTEVNGATMATGAYPNRTGILGNREYRPAIDPHKPIETGSPATITKGDEVSGGHYLLLPTLPETLRGAGRKVVIAGTKPIAVLYDRLHREQITQPNDEHPQTPNTDLDAATTQALIGSRWKDGVPAYSLLWLSEPDLAQHITGPGSPASLQALKGADANLARVLRELDKRGVRNQTDVFVVSDHGFSTITRAVDVAAELKKAGFSAVREVKEPAAAGDVLVVGNGGSVLLYVTGKEKSRTQQLVRFLQKQDWTGVVFTRESMTGTFTLDQVRINTPTAPDIVVALRWWPGKSATGMPGLIVNEGNARDPGQGAHASLSPFDMRATLVAAGPDFRRGMVDQLPSGNADLVPTILHILGIEPPQPLDGRVLAEALVAGTATFPAVELQTLEASCELGEVVWHQYLRTTSFAHAIYFDEGNGYVTPK
ncbi:MAG TPA: alkaline phosphatase family protein [Verrucomicrobiae bacterium]|nr:alkaline phosphatase family protein [Verrucomicrobiae bacterium]